MKAEIILKKEDNLWICEMPYLRVLAFGRTLSEAMYDFAEHVVGQIEDINNESNDMLTIDAIEIKNRLTEFRGEP